MPYKIVLSCILQEVVVKYRNNPDEFGRIMNELAENDFKIAPSQYDFLSDDFWEDMLVDISKAMDK